MGNTGDTTILPIKQQMKKITSKLGYLNANIWNTTSNLDNNVLRLVAINKEVASKLQEINTILEQEISNFRSTRRDTTCLGICDDDK